MTVSPPARPRVLLVDDDQNVLDALRRRLRNQFDLAVAADPARGLETLSSDGPFAVIVSDLNMPGMDGVELLSRAREQTPETVRILLTGHADLDAALSAVNEGHVFRFLTKPIDAAVLAASLDAAAKQHDLIVAERVLLRETLHGAVRALIELLGLTNPHIFGYATIIKERATAIARRLGAGEDWTIEVAAMLSQVGTVTLPPDTVRKLHMGRPLTRAEREAAGRVPDVVERLLENIPRMEPVREILALQDCPFHPRGTGLPLGARILKATVDFGILEAQGQQHQQAIETLRGRDGRYDPDVLTALEEEVIRTDAAPGRCHLRLSDLDVGCRLQEDLISDSGMLLLARGQVVNAAILERIRNSWTAVMGDRVVAVYRDPRRERPTEPSTTAA